MKSSIIHPVILPTLTGLGFFPFELIELIDHLENNERIFTEVLSSGYQWVAEFQVFPFLLFP